MSVVSGTPTSQHRASRRLRVALFTGASTALACSLSIAVPAASAVTPRSTPGKAASSATVYPSGVFDLNEPSYMAPPTTSALAGYSRTYVDDFTQPLSQSWFLFSGVPIGDPSGRFDPLHVAVTKGMLKIGTWRDPRYDNHWVSGGAGLSGIKGTYGAYFVRSRETAAGPDTTALLWPSNNQWPPEIDFVEAGESSGYESWFVHYDTPKDQVYGGTPINVTHWHTWGVIWTASSITFTVDGKLWGEVTNTSEIPTITMELDLQAQSWCGISGEPCPKVSSTYEIDWVAYYSPNG
jgi:hypothetical protein